MRRVLDAARAVRRRFGRTEADAAREMRAHLDLEMEEHLEAGTPPGEAREAALRTMGNITLFEEQVREQSPWAWWDQLRQDLRHGRRSFRRSPAFTLTAVLTIALGVGANGAIFSVIDALALRPLPVRDPERLVLLRDTKLENFTYPDYLTLSDNNRTLDGLAAASNAQPVPIDTGGEAEIGAAKVVSSNYFSMLGVRPAAGRLFAPGDDTQALAVISHAFWRQRFGGAPDAVGRAVKVRGAAFTVAGVSDAAFTGETPGEAPDVWTTVVLMSPQQLSERGFSWLYPIGRLRPGATLEQAQADLSRLLEPGAVPAAPRVELSPGSHGSARWRSRVATPLVVLMTLVGLVLVIACANLASLLLTRGAAEQREIGMRLALGASRGRVLRQLMTETLMLAMAGGVLSLGIGIWGGDVLVRLASGINPGAPLRLDLGFGLRLLLFTVVCAAVAGLLFGLAPALRTVRQAARGGVAAGQRAVTLERPWGLRGLFTIVQVALSLVLVAASVMFMRTLGNLERVDVGFEPDRLLRVELAPDRGHRPAATFFPQLLERARAVPGVQSATLALFGALSNQGGVNGLQFDGYSTRDPQDRRARADWVGPDYFRTIGVRLVAGRDFAASDTGTTQKVAALNQTAARFYFGSDTAALGRGLTFNDDRYDIIAIVADGKYADMREAPLRMVYFAAAQRGGPAGVLEVRAASPDTSTVIASVRAAVRDVDPRIAVVDARPMSAIIDRKIGRERLVAAISSLFGGLTVVLVSLGVYGTVAYTASRRTKELGIRLALGAERRSVIWRVVRDVGVAVAAGIAIGTAGAIGAGRFLESLLFGLEPTDATTFAGAIVLLAGVATLAAFFPAFRASRLDPASVLRE